MASLAACQAPSGPLVAVVVAAVAVVVVVVAAVAAVVAAAPGAVVVVAPAGPAPAAAAFGPASDVWAGASRTRPRTNCPRPGPPRPVATWGGAGCGGGDGAGGGLSLSVSNFDSTLARSPATQGYGGAVTHCFVAMTHKPPRVLLAPIDHHVDDIASRRRAGPNMLLLGLEQDMRLFKSRFSSSQTILSMISGGSPFLCIKA